MPKVTLLRPFVFSPPLKAEARTTQEHRFIPNKDPHTAMWVPTEVDLSEEIAAHPWIAEPNFADGCIEDPAVSAARLEASMARIAEQHKDDEKQLLLAEQALARSTKRHDITEATDEEVQKDLNTPVNELRSKRGKDIDKRAS